MVKDVVVIAHNLRSAHNVGSIFRTCEGMGVKKLVLSGVTPYPEKADDPRLPHIYKRASRAINKTALGSENSISWEQSSNVESAIDKLKSAGYTIASLEQSPKSQPINRYSAPDKIALIIGNEVSGISEKILKLSDVILEIPMKGKKESFNVAQAAAMALYSLIYN